MTPADELYQAAKTIREIAEAAPPGPWSVRDAWGPSPQVSGPPLMNARRIANDEQTTVLEPSHTGRDIVATQETFEHIALWHPGVAVLVADWLEAVAQTWDFLIMFAAEWTPKNEAGRSLRSSFASGPNGAEHALAIARAINHRKES